MNAASPSPGQAPALLAAELSTTETTPSWLRVPVLHRWLTRMQHGLEIVRGQLVTAGAHPLLRKRQRRLRISETLSLGDKRFVSILEVDGQSFLVGGSGASIALLATLAPNPAPSLISEPGSFERILGASLARSEAS